MVQVRVPDGGATATRWAMSAAGTVQAAGTVPAAETHGRRAQFRFSREFCDV
jgi:hypothetical protein